MLRGRLAYCAERWGAAAEALASGNAGPEGGLDSLGLSGVLAARRGARAISPRAAGGVMTRRQGDGFIGTYGTCTICGEGISLARLRTLPAVSCCVGCAERREQSAPPRPNLKAI